MRTLPSKGLSKTGDSKQRHALRSDTHLGSAEPLVPVDLNGK
jgi:hypothetical protein